MDQSFESFEKMNSGKSIELVCEVNAKSWNCRYPTTLFERTAARQNYKEARARSSAA